MYAPLIEISSFADLGDADQARILRFLLEALTYANVLYLRNNPETPSLYEAAPLYIKKSRPYGLDSWQDIPATLKRGSGDCKDFCSWRLAELIIANPPNVKTTSGDFLFQMQELSNGEQILHVVLRLENGQIEDPTKLLPCG